MRKIILDKTAKTGQTSPTVEIAARICAVRSNDLDEPTTTATKRLIADGIAVAIAGSREAAPAIAAEHVRAMGCNADASVWSFGFKTTAQQAAWLNAIS